MRRTSAVLLSAVVVALGVPAAGQASAEVGAFACGVSTLPNPADGSARVTAMSGTTFYGSVTTDAGNRSGVVWRDGEIVDTLTFRPTDANASGVLIGYRHVPSRGMSVPVGQRPGEEPVDLGALQDSVSDINDAGDWVGRASVGHFPYYFSLALFGGSDPWVTGSLESSLETSIGAFAIDEGGLALGRSDYDRDGIATTAVWRTGTRDAPQNLGLADELQAVDIDAGTALVNRVPQDDIALIDVASGQLTAVPGSSGYHAYSVKNGTILAKGANGYALFRDGTRIDLTPPAGSTITSASTLSSDGSTVGGQTETTDGTLVPTVWHCG